MPWKKTDKPCNLGGLSVLVTRPADQAATLAEAISAAHGRPVSFPAVEILGPADKQSVRAQLAGLNEYDLVIFISANAVQYAFPLMPEHIPLNLEVAAVGKATARKLTEYGLDATLVPENAMDSEGLLALPQLQSVNGQRVLIVRGNGGREVLRETLQDRGATVNYAEVYRRQLPRRKPANLVSNWSRLVEAVTVTSGQILENLFLLLGDEGLTALCNTPMVVCSDRVAKQAAAKGCGIIYLADSPMDADILRSLCEIYETHYR